MKRNKRGWAELVLTAGVLLSGTAVYGDQVKWTGSSSTAWATVGNWTNLTTGINNVPLSTDAVVIDGGVNQPTLDLMGGAVTIASLDLGASAASTLTVQNGDVTTKNLIVSGNATIGDYGTLTHTAEPAVQTETHRLFLKVNGNLSIASGGKIDVSACGFPSGYGPGYGNQRAGAGHGGEGGVVLSGGVPYGHQGTTYGSIVNPVRCGSGSGGGQGSAAGLRGGGVIILDVDGDMIHDGTIVADGQSAPAADVGGGAGGSINIRAATLSGIGHITAVGGLGGSSGLCSGGGGGRVAVALSAADTFGDVTFSLVGGSVAGGLVWNKNAGAAGTLYLKGKSQAFGTLIVENDKITPTAGSATGTPLPRTLIRDLVTDKTVGNVQLRNMGRMEIETGETLEVRGSWSNAVDTAALTGAGTVLFAGPDTATFYGDTTFANLICTNAGKTLRYEAGKTQTLTSGLTLTGADGNLIVLESTDPAQQWNIRVAPGATQYDVSYLSVSNSHAGTPPDYSTITATDSEDKGGNVNWVFASGPAPIVWDGSESTDWNTSENWDLGRVPLQGDPSITIAPAANQPLLNRAYASPGFDGSLTIQSGASLNLNGHDLRIGGAVINAGTLTATGSELLRFEGAVDFTGGTFNRAQSTLQLDGSGAQTFAPSDNTFYALDIVNTQAVTVANGFAARDLSFPATTAAVDFQGGFTVTNLRMVVSNGATLTFGSGENYTVYEQLVLRGASGSHIALTASGVWDLIARGSVIVRYVSVDHSDASGGRTIYAVDSTDNNGNGNWNFGTGKLWVGTTTAWTTAGNWSPSGVPDATHVVMIDGTAAFVPRLMAGTGIAALIVAGLPTTPATLTVDMPFAGPDALEVTGDVLVGPNATLTHTPEPAGQTESYRLSLTVGGDLRVYAGSAIDVSTCGFSSGYGPGYGSQRTGAGHGGEGGVALKNGDPFGHQGTTYGSIVNPVRCGSGSALRGGGVVILDVDGDMIHDGTIVADGQSATAADVGGGAGGSINIRAATLSGTGRITAVGGLGGNSSLCCGGGGGRIAVALSAADTFGDVIFSLVGGSALNGLGANRNAGAAGTLYLKGKSQAFGTLIVENDKITPTAGSEAGTPLPRTHIPAAVDPFPGELQGLAVRVADRGAVAITASDRVGSLTVDSATQPLNLNLGTNGTVLTTETIAVNGTVYTKAGLYTKNNWNGFSTPANVTGDGAIEIRMRGTVVNLR